MYRFVECFDKNHKKCLKFNIILYLSPLLYTEKNSYFKNMFSVNVNEEKSLE